MFPHQGPNFTAVTDLISRYSILALFLLSLSGYRVLQAGGHQVNCAAVCPLVEAAQLGGEEVNHPGCKTHSELCHVGPPDGIIAWTGQDMGNSAPMTWYVHQYLISTFPHECSLLSLFSTSPTPGPLHTFLVVFLSETCPGDGDQMMVTHLGCCTRGSLDRPGPTFSEGAISSVSHELEQMMYKFSQLPTSQNQSLLCQMVTLSNTINVLLASLYSQTC